MRADVIARYEQELQSFLLRLGKKSASDAGGHLYTL